MQKYCKRYEAYVGNRTTESLLGSFITLFSKGVGIVVSIYDVKELQEELNNDYIINQELSSLAGVRALRCGTPGLALANANAALITTKHIKFEKEPENEAYPPPTYPSRNSEGPTHPSRDNEGYPLIDFDKVDK